ncbi:MAG: MFS transporter [Acidobacteria bacterium]|nr:MFS transporter [Acidobacteriota bacterium]
MKPPERLVVLASLGGTLEFYDFVVFGIFSKDIADAVFPAASPLASLMASFAAFAAGYLARPIGGLLLSHYGDRFGRRKVFLWSVFVMSAATVAMGLVPSVASVGVAASVAMVVLRIVQGLCLGGELPGALTYVVETARGSAPFVCGLVFACVTMGVAAASGVSTALRSLLDPAVVSVWGWRLAFIIGGLGGVLSYVLRRSLEESPEFERMKALAVRYPFAELLRTRPMAVLVGVTVLAGTACFNGLFFSHLPAYLAGVLRYDAREAVGAQTAGVLVSAASILVVGWIAERVAPRHLLRAGVALLALGAWPFYSALAARSVNLQVALIAAGLVAGLTNGSFAVILTDLFPTRIRFTGVALAFNIAFTLFSGLSPLVATSLIRSTGSAVSPAWLMIGSALIALAGSYGVTRCGGHVMRAETVDTANCSSLIANR